MRRKLMFHYFISFVVACLIIAVVNIVYMRNSIMKVGALYNYHPEEMITSFAKEIQLDSNHKISITQTARTFLEANHIGLQILDHDNYVIYEEQVPKDLPLQYSNLSLLDLYNRTDLTAFAGEFRSTHDTFTYILFVPPEQIRRVHFTYDVSKVLSAHNFPLLIVLNILLLIVTSFLFTFRLLRPISKLITNIMVLNTGCYTLPPLADTLYLEVDEALHVLANRLTSTEKERHKLEVMREEWISNISHDLKTPLTSIIGNAELLGDPSYVTSPEILETYSQTILRKSLYIKDLIDDLNLSSRLVANVLTLNLQPTNLVTLVRHTLIDIMNDPSFPSFDLSFEYKPDDCTATVDATLISRVINNLIHNAIKHNDTRLALHVKITGYIDTVSIVIADNGSGVTDEALAHLFTRYYRGTHTNHKTEGSGLGLAIAHDIIKCHQGTITASHNIPHGLILTITLPYIFS